MKIRGFLTLSNWRKIESGTGSIGIIIVAESTWHLLARNEDQAIFCPRSTIFPAGLSAKVSDLS